MTPEYLLAHRCAQSRAKLAVCEIDSIGVALKSNMIGCDEALAWLCEVDAMKYLLDPNDTDTGAKAA
jgi:hypothetical protein